MLTLPQHGGNRFSKDLKFINFPGEDTPGRPYWGTKFGSPPHFVEPPLLTTWTAPGLWLGEEIGGGFLHDPLRPLHEAI